MTIKKQSAPSGDLGGLIVGLGNPGLKYERTRHNLGFMAVCALLVDLSVRGVIVEELHSGSKFQCRLWRCALPGCSVHWLAAMPLTFMNLSGESVQPLLNWYKLAPHQLLIIHDELDLPLGNLKLKNGGGTAGHNGLKSISERLGTRDFYRLRMGVGRPPALADAIGWVLGSFAPDEQKIAETMLSKAVEGVLLFAEQGAAKAATIINAGPQKKREPKNINGES